MFKVVVDEVLAPRDLGPLWWVALTYLALTVGSGLIPAADRYVGSWVAGQFLLGVRTRFFAHLQGLSLDFFDRRTWAT